MSMVACGHCGHVVSEPEFTVPCQHGTLGYAHRACEASGQDFTVPHSHRDCAQIHLVCGRDEPVRHITGCGNERMHAQWAYDYNTALFARRVAKQTGLEVAS